MARHLIFLAIIICLIMPEVFPLEVMTWEKHQILDAENKFHVFWNEDDVKLTMEIQVETLGWVGIGFSSNGAMPGADIYMAWIRDGEITAHDRYATAFDTPLIDGKQDYELLGGYENETHTTIRFSRDWNTCDGNLHQDYLLEDGTVRMIWAYHQQDPQDAANPPQHSYQTRGAKSIVLKGSSEIEFVRTPDMKSWDVFRHDYEIPSYTDTTYLCEIIKAPQELLDKKHHVVAVCITYSLYCFYLQRKPRLMLASVDVVVLLLSWGKKSFSLMNDLQDLKLILDTSQ